MTEKVGIPTKRWRIFSILSSLPLPVLTVQEPLRKLTNDLPYFIAQSTSPRSFIGPAPHSFSPEGTALSGLSLPRSPNKFNNSTNGEPKQFTFYNRSSYLQTSQRQNTRPTSSVPELQKRTGKACEYVKRADVSIKDSHTKEGLLTGEAHCCLQIYCYQARWCPSMQLTPGILESAVFETQWYYLTEC